MIDRYKKNIFISALYIATIVINVQACMTTFINDSNSKVAIYNEHDKAFLIIPKSGKRRFGNHDKHAYFVVYAQQPKTKTEVWIPVYTCTQNECGNNGNIVLKFSDIEDGTQATSLFTIVKNKPHSSMVRELPMIQRKNCSSCN
ncbi:MAG TPA: hypothetical protein VLB80_00180 [Candidatus Babeliales bacterium]|nr:hypothetical protein [Candidatus Babeliales bacterium]